MYNKGHGTDFVEALYRRSAGRSTLEQANYYQDASEDCQPVNNQPHNRSNKLFPMDDSPVACENDVAILGCDKEISRNRLSCPYLVICIIHIDHPFPRMITGIRKKISDRRESRVLVAHICSDFFLSCRDNNPLRGNSLQEFHTRRSIRSMVWCLKYCRSQSRSDCG